MSARTPARGAHRPSLSRSPRRRGLVGATVAALVASPLALGLATPAAADVATKIATLPYTQDWSNAGLIAANDDWSGVTGVQGYLGQNITTATNGVDPQTLLTESTLADDTDVIANQTNPNTNSSGGVAEFAIADSTIALQGSGTADAPYVAFHLDLTGQTNVSFAFNARDIDGSADDAVQQIAVQYRVGGSGPFTNLPDGYIADATTSNAATQVTAESVALPAAADNQASVFVRVITSNASGSDEWVGIDDVAVTAEGGASALSLTNPGPQSSTVGTPITPVTLSAGGGTSPYTFAATNLPDGLVLDTDSGEITGTPTTVGTPSVEVSVTDADDVRDAETFVWTVSNPLQPIAIADIQGPGATSPLAGQTVRTRGVVTATYPTGGINGFVIQTGGTGGATDATPGASDAIFVWGGSDGFATYPAIGDSLEVTGDAVEGGGPATGLTELIVDVDADVVELGTPLLPVTALVTGFPTTAAEREAHESELVRPTGAFTVSDVYDGSPSASSGFNSYGEITLAAGDTTLTQPTEVEDAQTGDIAGVEADNAARRVLLDDGASINFVTSPGFNNVLPWMTKTYAPRSGASASFAAPVILEFRDGFWKFQPTTRVVDAGTDVVSFEDTRTPNLFPRDVGGELKIATFNVLNYFNTTGQAWVSSNRGTCSYFNDRAGTPIGNSNCTNNGPRGAATDVSFERQQAKIVNAINRLDADVVSLEEIENSIALGEADRDDALSALVDALNEAAGTTRWAFVPSPSAAELPPVSEQDVIRNAFIYDPSTVTLVGESQVLVGNADFSNAREPLAQAFKAVGAPDDEAFGVIVNHFKSKGAPSGNSACTGLGDNSDPVQGCYNGDRLRQAQGLAAFADDFATDRGVEAMFLTGDFNAYSQEDPTQALVAAGYTNLESDTEGEESYSFNGLAGSLDHVFANEAAMAWIDGVDIWEVNANESVFYQYSRFNYTASDLFDATVPFAASDHNPEIVGITPGSVAPPPPPPPGPGAVDTTVTATATTVVYGTTGTVSVRVSPSTATGTVAVAKGADVLGTTTLAAGAGTITLAARSLPVGTHVLTVTYAGDAGHKTSTGTVSVVVEKAEPTVTVKVKPKKVVAGKTKATIVVKVRAEGYTPTGRVSVKVAGKTYKAKVKDGKAVVKLKKFKKPGRYQAKIAYTGDANTTRAKATTKIKVKRR